MKDTAESPAAEKTNLGFVDDSAELMPFGSMNWELRVAMLTEVP
jgi:hypothetical protein